MPLALALLRLSGQAWASAFGNVHRPQIGEQAELLADAQQCGALGPFLLGNCRITIRQAHRAEQDGVRFALHKASVASGSAFACGVDSRPSRPAPR